MKGTLNAFRNFTNRMEEAVGDCTNLHISYPALVYGFLHILKATREDETAKRNDIFVLRDGVISDNIERYHDVMSRLTGRSDVRDEISRYEAVSILSVTLDGDQNKYIFEDFPKTDSPLHFDNFMDTIYRKYDERFVYAAPTLRRKTSRLEWDPNSPAISELPVEDLSLRVRSSE